MELRNNDNLSLFIQLGKVNNHKMNKKKKARVSEYGP